jgi:hypothetical protein
MTLVSLSLSHSPPSLYQAFSAPFERLVCVDLPCPCGADR